MTRPTDIYESISRPLLENFLYQHQETVVQFDDSLRSGYARGRLCTLTYKFECPTDTAANQLKGYLLEQTDDAVSIRRDGDATWLSGTSEDIDYDLGLILKVVGYWCDAGSQSGCRFDGWSAKQHTHDDDSAADAAGPIALPPDVADDPKATQRAAIWSASGREYYLIRRGAFDDNAIWGMLAVDLMRHAARAHSDGKDSGAIYKEILAGFMVEMKNPTG